MKTYIHAYLQLPQQLSIRFYFLLLMFIDLPASAHEASLGDMAEMKKISKCDSLKGFPKLYINPNDPFDSSKTKPQTILFNIFNRNYSDAVFWCHWKDNEQYSLLFWSKNHNYCPKLIQSKKLILGELNPTENGFKIINNNQSQIWTCSNHQWMIIDK